MISILIVILFFSILFLIRNEWVYKRRIEFNSAIFNFRRNLITQDYNLYKQLPDYRAFTNAVYSYNRMLFYFWIWDFDKLVANQKLYNMIKGRSER